MNKDQSLFIPVILGTTRKGRMSEHAANFVMNELSQKPDVDTELIDICFIDVPFDDAGTQAQNSVFASKMERSDGVIIVAPEYNHGYPGMLKHVLDTNLKEYIHKAVGICGVSAGPFGGTRVIESLLPVMRELGMVTIFWDINFSRVQTVFNEMGKLLDEVYIKRTDKFLNELIWMAKVLRHGRENISTDPECMDTNLRRGAEKVGE